MKISLERLLVESSKLQTVAGPQSYYVIRNVTVESAGSSGHRVKTNVDRSERSSLIPECTDRSDFGDCCRIRRQSPFRRIRRQIVAVSGEFGDYIRQCGQGFMNIREAYILLLLLLLYCVRSTRMQQCYYVYVERRLTA